MGWSAGAVHISTARSRGIDFGRRAVAERLMDALVIIEGKVRPQPGAGLAHAAIVMQVDFFIFHRAPEPLGENIIEGPPAPIHTDAHSSRRQQVCILRTGEVTALVAVEDLRRGRRQRPLHGDRHKRLGQRLVQLPTQHITAEPIQHGHQIQPASVRPHIGDINGLLTNDKFCFVRVRPVSRALLRLTARQQRLAEIAVRYSSSDSVAHYQGGYHETQLADPAAAPTDSQRTPALGSGLPIPLAVDTRSGPGSNNEPAALNDQRSGGTPCV